MLKRGARLLFGKVKDINHTWMMTITTTDGEKREWNFVQLCSVPKIYHLCDVGECKLNALREYSHIHALVRAIIDHWEQHFCHFSFFLKFPPYGGCVRRSQWFIYVCSYANIHHGIAIITSSSLGQPKIRCSELWQIFLLAEKRKIACFSPMHYDRNNSMTFSGSPYSYKLTIKYKKRENMWL